MALASRFCSKEQQQHLAQHHQLPPVEPLHVPEVLLHLFGGQYAQRKGAQGHQIMQHPLPVPVHQVGTEQHDVAGLRVGKYLAAEQVGVGVLQAAGQGQEYGCKKRFGHLSAMFWFHACTFFFCSPIIVHFCGPADISFTWPTCFGCKLCRRTTGKRRYSFPAFSSFFTSNRSLHSAVYRLRISSSAGARSGTITVTKPPRAPARTPL